MFTSVVNVYRNQITPVVTGCTSAGTSFSQLFVKLYEKDGAPGLLQLGLANVAGTFSALQVNIEWSPTNSTGQYFEVVGTWSPLSQGVGFFPISESGFYRLNVSTFTGGTSFDVLATVGLPAGSISTGGGSGPTGNVSLVGSSITLPVSFSQPVSVTLDNSGHNTFAVDTGLNLLSVTGSSLVPILSVQPVSGSNATKFLLKSLGIEGNGSMGRYQIVRNPALAGASFAAVGGSSLMNVDTSATARTGGQVIASGGFSIGSREENYTSIQTNFVGPTGDIFSLIVVGMNGSPVMTAASLRWTEE
jgi:hypothetical protein